MVWRQSLGEGPNGWLAQLLTSASQAVATGEGGVVASSVTVTVGGSRPDELCS
jgi:hypothetical protein